jgi:hypothetical protein
MDVKANVGIGTWNVPGSKKELWIALYPLYLGYILGLTTLGQSTEVSTYINHGQAPLPR